MYDRELTVRQFDNQMNENPSHFHMEFFAPYEINSWGWSTTLWKKNWLAVTWEDDQFAIWYDWTRHILNNFKYFKNVEQSKISEYTHNIFGYNWLNSTLADVNHMRFSRTISEYESDAWAIELAFQWAKQYHLFEFFYFFKFRLLVFCFKLPNFNLYLLTLWYLFPPFFLSTSFLLLLFLWSEYFCGIWIILLLFNGIVFFTYWSNW